MKSNFSVISLRQTFLAMARTHLASMHIGVSVTFVALQTVDCHDTTASGISRPGATWVNEDIGSTSIHAVSTGLAKQTGISADEYASITCACFDLTKVDLLGGGMKS